MALMQSTTIFLSARQFWHGDERKKCPNKQPGEPRASLLFISQKAVLQNKSPCVFLGQQSKMCSVEPWCHGLKVVWTSRKPRAVLTRAPAESIASVWGLGLTLNHIFASSGSEICPTPMKSIFSMYLFRFVVLAKIQFCSCYQIFEHDQSLTHPLHDVDVNLNTIVRFVNVLCVLESWYI